MKQGNKEKKERKKEYNAVHLQNLISNDILALWNYFLLRGNPKISIDEVKCLFKID